MKISLIIPVLNEARSIEALLDSILIQTKLPDELIIVDGGSTDATVAVIKQHSVWQTLTVRLLTLPGSNCSQNRNLGIREAKYPVLALTDSGCVLAKDWLEKITSPLNNPKIDSVAGYYQVGAKTAFSQAVTPFVSIMPDKLEVKTYLPSSRSIAFKKSAWTKVGGYPENLNYCDDLLFAGKLKAKTRMVVKPDALVYWEPIKNLNEFFTKIKNYASGDVKAGYWPHLTKIATVYLRYCLFYFFPPLFIAYWFWPIIKFNRYLKNPLAYFLLPVVQVTADLAVLRGSLAGLKLRLEKAF